MVCLTLIIVSTLLYLGSKHNRSLYFVPWLTEQIIAISVGIIQTLIMSMGGLMNNISAGHFIITFLIFSTNSLFVYAVISHFILLRKMKKHSKEIIQSVMNGKLFHTILRVLFSRENAK